MKILIKEIYHWEDWEVKTEYEKNEKGKIATDAVEIKKKNNEKSFVEFYASKFWNSDEINTFPKIYKGSKLVKEERKSIDG